jgi:beta-glucanase (GH16 family)
MALRFRRRQMLLLGLLLVSTNSVVTANWIDPDTPISAFITHSTVNEAELDLVFSDEFKVSGRSFDDGHDPRWTALNKNDYTNDALQYVQYIFLFVILQLISGFEKKTCVYFFKNYVSYIVFVSKLFPRYPSHSFSLHVTHRYYDKDHVTTAGGYLNITTTAEHTSFTAYDVKTHKLSKQRKNFKSGMVQGWNKFCFTGGVIEVYII